MKVIRLIYGDKYWSQTIDYIGSCTWIASEHLAISMGKNNFNNWESVFIALGEGDKINGFCTLKKEDYYPDNKYSPWISNIFVDEKARGHRISQKMIEYVMEYAKELGFLKVYIPSDIKGLYEKFGFLEVDKLKNYGGDIDTIFMKEV